ncbi:MAG: glycine C-acetyltransferase [Patescibacteria group bacterium]
MKRFIDNLTQELQKFRDEGVYKEERVLSSRQGREITVGDKTMLNFCANNYLGLSGSPLLAEASEKVLERWGYGLASVRFICGTQEIHKTLEKKIAEFVGCEDAVLYSSCFMANVGLFQTFFTEEDAIISDALNHASIIDAIRLTKSERLVYAHMDMADLEQKLISTKDKRYRVIATDGVFSMDGHIAPLKSIVALAEKYDALVFVDDAHATGVMGDTGRGVAEAEGVLGKIDFITGTFGKALGGAGGAFTATNARVAEYLRQKSRSYLFSNSLDTVITGTSIAALAHIQAHPELRSSLWSNTTLFRSRMKEAGFSVSVAPHPITPIMVGDEKKATDMARALYEKGIYVIGFSYPVVPKGTARIRVQISAAHTEEDIIFAVEKFTEVGKTFGIL